LNTLAFKSRISLVPDRKIGRLALSITAKRGTDALA
jgi:hypothetical protein